MNNKSILIQQLKEHYPIFIACHIGAGYHSIKLRKSYKQSINNALLKTLDIIYEKFYFLINDLNNNQLDNNNINNNSNYQINNINNTQINNLLKDNGVDSIWIVETIISILEDDPLTNSGIGSNLNFDGEVECDASIMSGEFICNCNNNCFENSSNNNDKFNRICGGGIWAGVGAISGVKNPIKLTCELLRKQKLKGSTKSLGRQRPIMLTGEGAKQWAQNHNIETYDKNNSILGDPLITQQSNINWMKYKSKLEDYKFNKNQQYNNNNNNNNNNSEYYDDNGYDEEQEEYNNVNYDNNQLYDTVGAIAIDWNGLIASGVSSGGILLKHSGRVGEAAVYGAGCWAQNELNLNGYKLPGVAASATGVGEQLSKSLISKECCLKILKRKFIDIAVKEFFEDNFLSHNDCFSYLNELLINQFNNNNNKNNSNNNNQSNNSSDGKSNNQNSNSQSERESEKDNVESEEEEEEYNNTNIISNFSGENRLGGLITLKKETNSNNETEIEFLWAHSTETMGIGYIESMSSKPKSSISVNSSNKPGYNFKISSKRIILKNKIK